MSHYLPDCPSMDRKFGNNSTLICLSFVNMRKLWNCPFSYWLVASGLLFFPPLTISINSILNRCILWLFWSWKTKKIGFWFKKIGEFSFNGSAHMQPQLTSLTKKGKVASSSGSSYLFAFYLYQMKVKGQKGMLDPWRMPKEHKGCKR